MNYLLTQKYQHSSANGNYEYYDDPTGTFRLNKDPYFIFQTEQTGYTYIPELVALSCENPKCAKTPVESSALCKVAEHIWFELSGLCEESTYRHKGTRNVKDVNNGFDDIVEMNDTTEKDKSGSILFVTSTPQKRDFQCEECKNGTQRYSISWQKQATQSIFHG